MGLPFHRISNNFRGTNEAMLQISLIKLERMGYLSKTVETDDHDGYDFYAYSITEMGIDMLLQNEDILLPKPPAPLLGFESDVPF